MANTLTQAQQNIITNSGTSKNQFTNVQTLLELKAQKFILEVQKNISLNKDIIVTGAIENLSIKATDNKLIITGAKELLYQSRGVNGAVKKLYNTPHSYKDKRPPIGVFVDWIKRRNLQKVNEKKKFGSFAAESPFKEHTSDEDINSLAWAISTKIYQEGFKPRNLIEKPIENLVKDVKKDFKNFCIQQVKQNIEVKDSAKRVIVKL